MAGSYGKRDWSQSKSWGQSGPYSEQRKGTQKGGWRQSSGDWRQPDQWQGAGAWRGQSGHQDWGGRSARKGGALKGVWDAVEVARSAVETAATFRSLVAPATAEQQAASSGGAAPKTWLATAKGWLLGETPQVSQGSQPATPSGKPQDLPQTEQLLGRLLGGGTEARAPLQDDPQQELLTLMSKELATQRKVLTALVDRVEPQAAKAPQPQREAVQQATQQRKGLAQALGLEDDDDDVRANALLITEVIRLSKERKGAAASQAGSDSSTLPLAAEARHSLTRAEFDVEGEVTPEGHAAFWGWLDDTPKAAWPLAAPYGTWAKKISYKCSVADLHRWMRLKQLAPDDAALQARSREELLHALAKAAMESAPESAGSVQVKKKAPLKQASLSETLGSPKQQ